MGGTSKGKVRKTRSSKLENGIRFGSGPANQLVGPTSQPVGPATFVAVLLGISFLQQCCAADAVQLIHFCQANRD